MKNFKKVLAVMTAVASLCMSATAFAAEGSVSSSQDLAGTYDVANNILNITNNNAVLANSETTILVLTGELTDDEAANVTEGKIMYINQQNTTTDGKNFTDMGLKLPTGSETLGVGSYPVKVGCYNATTGDFEIKNATLEVTDGGTTVKIIWGDIDLSGTVNVNDAGKIMNSLIGGTKQYGDYTIGEVFAKDYIWGDIDLSGTVNVNDAGKIMNSLIGGTKQYGDFTIGVETEIK